MNKQEFLQILREHLSGLSENDIEKSLDYYSEIIDDRMEDGLTEEEAVEVLGSAEEIADQLLLDMPLSKLVKAKVKPINPLRAGEIVLLVLGSPIWLSLLLAAVLVVFAFYLVIWSGIIVLYAVDLSIVAGAISGIFLTVIYIFSGKFAQALFAVGVGLLCAGAAVLCFFLFNKITVGVVKISKRFVRNLKFLFIRKGNER